MKLISILLLTILVISCGSLKKSVRSFTQEIEKTENFKRDSSLKQEYKSEAKKVDSSRVIEKEDSGYERETIEEITESPYMPIGQEYVDTPALQPLPGGAIPVTRTIKRTIREKGQKKTEVSSQAAVKEENKEQVSTTAHVAEEKKVDTSAKIAVKGKDVKRSGLPWYLWLAIIVSAGLLIYRYRWRIVHAWYLAAFRLFGIKRPNNDRA